MKPNRTLNKIGVHNIIHHLCPEQVISIRRRRDGVFLETIFDGTVHDLHNCKEMTQRLNVMFFKGLRAENGTLVIGVAE
jgi:hypothetical protein